MYNFTLIGDSLTNYGFQQKYGWPQLLHSLFPKAHVMNYGFSGYTSAMLQSMIKRLIPNKNVFFATILLGTNDCYSSSFVTPKQYKQNINYIINHIHKLNPSCIILLITPPICKLNDFIFEYIEQVKAIGKENTNIQIVDLHSGPYQIVLEDLYDGVHFGESGHRKLFNNIQHTIKEKYNHVSFQHLL
jgi:lysophospholipase L1-like esterase